MGIFEHYSFEVTPLVLSLKDAIQRVVLTTDNLNNIPVNMVVKEANVARSSFYRFFYDIYDLENYVYFYDIEHDYEKRKCKSLKELIIRNNQILLNNSSYYKQLYSINNKNSFRNFFISFWYEKLKVAVLKNLGESDYTAKTDASLYASVSAVEGLVRNWITKKSDVLTIEDIADLSASHFDDNIKAIIELPFQVSA